WSRKHHAALQIFHAVRERTCEFRTLIETDEEEFILRVCRFEELNCRFARFGDLVRHASAEIEDYPNGDGHIFRRKRHYFLLDVVFKYSEIVRLQPGYKAIVGIRHCDIHKREIHIDLQRLAWFKGHRWRVFLYVVFKADVFWLRVIPKRLRHGKNI